MFVSLCYLLHIENTWICFLFWLGKISICSYKSRETDKGTTRSVKTFSKNENIACIANRYEICVVFVSLFYLLHIENTWICFLFWLGKISICNYKIRETDKGTTRSVKTFSKNENIACIANRYEICVVFVSLFYLLHIENTWICFLFWLGKISICNYKIRETDKGTTRSVKTFSKNENIACIANRYEICVVFVSLFYLLHIENTWICFL